MLISIIFLVVLLQDVLLINKSLNKSIKNEIVLDIGFWVKL